MKSTCVKKFQAASLLTALVATPALALEGRWITGDFHQHSYVSDGSYSISTVQQKGFDFGLDWQANSEHGGTSDEAGDEPRRKWSSLLDSPRFLGSPNPYPKLWRWQTLADSDKVPAYLNAIRAGNRGKIVINGLELNMPGADHCSTAIVDPTGRAIAKFEYLWDKNDKAFCAPQRRRPRRVLRLRVGPRAPEGEGARWVRCRRLWRRAFGGRCTLC